MEQCCGNCGWFQKRQLFWGACTWAIPAKLKLPIYMVGNGTVRDFKGQGCPCWKEKEA